MSSKPIDIHAIEEVAKALSEFKEQMVFVGGAVVGLYADMLSEQEVRETFDIDLTHLKIATYLDYSKLTEELTKKGIYPDPHGHNICRMEYKGIKIDLMPSEDSEIGPSNRWYKFGFDNLIKVMVGSEEIQLLPAACFLATKFEAHNDRGNDYRTSQDFEDIVFVLDNRSGIVNEIAHAKKEVKDFLILEFKKISENKYKDEILSVHLTPFTLAERYLLLENIIDKIISL